VELTGQRLVEGTRLVKKRVKNEIKKKEEKRKGKQGCNVIK
jgi:hypothetical protein